MRSIRRSLRGFIARWARGAAAPPRDRPHARFLTSSGHFSRVKRYVKYAAFMPPRKDPDPRLSVFRINGLSKEGTTPLAQTVAREGARKVYGWAEFVAGAVGTARLTLVADEKPPRHAYIAGWPREKDARQALASELAEESVLRHEGDPWVDATGRVVG